MEPFIIKVNLNSRKKPYQLGIEVVPPDARSSTVSQAQQKRQQQASKQHNHQHEYQNLSSLPNGNCSPKQGKNQPNTNGILKQTSNQSNGHSAAAIPPISPKKSNFSYPTTKQHQGGLLITKIYQGSVIDECGQFRVGDIIVEVNGVNLLGRNFQEAQKILKTFVEQTSHCPLLLTVLRKASSSSSSVPSTTGSQITVIERSPQRATQKTDLSPTSSTTPKKSSLSTPSPQSSSSARHLSSSMNTRRIGTIHSVTLTKSNDGGFGIKIAERDNMFGTNRPIYITAITTTGSAFRDGRLKEGDMLLEVNGIDLYGKSQPEVTKMLKAVSVNETVEFVVSRQSDDKNVTQKEYLTVNQKNSLDALCDNNESLIDLNVPDQDDLVFSDMNIHQLEKKVDSSPDLPNVDGPGIYIYDIPLNDTKSAGLGLYLKCPNLDGKDLGIWIEKVITGGAAWKDNRLLPDDQILAINGINLMGLSNSVAYETLTAAVSRGTGPEATSNTVRLNIHRREPSVVAKLLHGTNNIIEHSDLPAHSLSQSHSISDKAINSTQDSYKTALDNTIIHSRSHSLNNANGSNSTDHSNHNSQNDSAMSPQTQASNSIKLSSSGIEKLDQNTSDSTNGTSSAISQITDFTFLPVTNDTTPEKNSTLPSDDQPPNQHFTIPKTLETATDATLDVDTASSTQSLDNETGEERFQRDGFGRQSVSEKRHTQLMANTDTFRRNQKLREEKERERQIAEQLERLQIENENHSRVQPHNYESQTLMRSMFRNRRFNESFRAAVDKSYVCGIDEPRGSLMRRSVISYHDTSNLTHPEMDARIQLLKKANQFQELDNRQSKAEKIFRDSDERRSDHKIEYLERTNARPILNSGESQAAISSEHEKNLDDAEGCKKKKKFPVIWLRNHYPFSKYYKKKNSERNGKCQEVDTVRRHSTKSVEVLDAKLSTRVKIPDHSTESIKFQRQSSSHNSNQQYQNKQYFSQQQFHQHHQQQVPFEDRLPSNYELNSQPGQVHYSGTGPYRQQIHDMHQVYVPIASNGGVAHGNPYGSSPAFSQGPPSHPPLAGYPQQQQHSYGSQRQPQVGASRPAPVHQMLQQPHYLGPQPQQVGPVRQMGQPSMMQEQHSVLMPEQLMPLSPIPPMMQPMQLNQLPSDVSLNEARSTMNKWHQLSQDARQQVGRAAQPLNLLPHHLDLDSRFYNGFTFQPAPELQDYVRIRHERINYGSKV